MVLRSFFSKLYLQNPFGTAIEPAGLNVELSPRFDISLCPLREIFCLPQNIIGLRIDFRIKRFCLTVSDACGVSCCCTDKPFGP